MGSRRCARSTSSTNPMGSTFFREFTDAGLRGLEEEFAMGQPARELGDRLRDLLGAVGHTTMRDAVNDRRPLESVLARLGMPVPSVEGERAPELEPEAEFEARGRQQPGVGRPSPFGADADKEIEDDIHTFPVFDPETGEPAVFTCPVRSHHGEE